MWRLWGMACREYSGDEDGRREEGLDSSCVFSLRLRHFFCLSIVLLVVEDWSCRGARGSPHSTAFHTHQRRHSSNHPCTTSTTDKSFSFITLPISLFHLSHVTNGLDSYFPCDIPGNGELNRGLQERKEHFGTAALLCIGVGWN